MTFARFFPAADCDSFGAVDVCADFGSFTVEMVKKDIRVHYQDIADSLQRPFLTALISSNKLPPEYKNMKWGEYRVIESFNIIIWIFAEISFICIL